MAFCFRIGYLILSNGDEDDAAENGGGEFYDVLICFTTLQLVLFFVCVLWFRIRRSVDRVQ